jgi:hypothetical protein
MPSPFQSFFGPGRTLLQQQLAQAVSWTKPGAAAATVQAIVGPDSLTLRETVGGVIRQRILTVQLLETDVPNPTRGDVCTVDGVSWGFDAVLWRQNGYVNVQLCRPEAAELSQGAYRDRP